MHVSLIPVLTRLHGGTGHVDTEVKAPHQQFSVFFLALSQGQWQVGLQQHPRAPLFQGVLRKPPFKLSLMEVKP